VEQIDLIRYTLDVLERLNLPYMVVGSFASTTFGEPRFTQDIDIVIDFPTSQIPAFCAAFSEPDFYISESAVRDAVQSRFQFNVLHTSSGNKIDFILPRKNDWGQTQLSRRKRVQLLPDREGYIASPEDVILGKMWYYSEGGSEKHLRDITGILKVSGDQVDQDEIARWAKKLGLSEIWEAILLQMKSNGNRNRSQ
jgi:hypothetical protein